MQNVSSSLDLSVSAGMRSFVDLLQDINVAVFTLLHAEEIREGLVYVPGIWMRLLLCNLPMAFHAGRLAMGRNMESFRVNQPPGGGILITRHRSAIEARMSRQSLPLRSDRVLFVSTFFNQGHEVAGDR